MSAPSCLVLIGFKNVFLPLMLDTGRSIREAPRGIAEVTRCIIGNVRASGWAGRSADVNSPRLQV